MAVLSSGIFRCVLLTPSGKVFDRRVGALVLPAHDGLMGVLRNHAPMLCELGTGIMQVKNIPDADDAFYLIDGGFVRISENHVTVLAYDVTTYEGMDPEEAQNLLSQAQSVLVSGAFAHQAEGMETERASLLVKMGHMSSLLSEK